MNDPGKERYIHGLRVMQQAMKQAGMREVVPRVKRHQHAHTDFVEYRPPVGLRAIVDIQFHPDSPYVRSIRKDVGVISIGKPCGMVLTTGMYPTFFLEHVQQVAISLQPKPRLPWWQRISRKLGALG